MSEESMEYAKRHLLTHLRQSGVSDQKIEIFISRLRQDNPLRKYITNQYLDSLSLKKRKNAEQRLSEIIITITVATLPDLPTFDIPTGFTASQIDVMVEDIYGTQDDGAPHEWQSDTPY